MEGVNRRDALKALGALGIASLIDSTGTSQILPLAPRPRFGLSNDLLIRPWGGESGPGIMTYDNLRTLQDHGINSMRLWVYWNNVQPTDAPLDSSSAGLQHLDMQVDIARRAGTDLYFSLMWAPRWATGGERTLEPWHCMDVKNAPALDRSKPECVNPPAFPAERFVEFAKFIAARYHPEYMGAWNEQQYAVFWPYRIQDGTAEGRPDTQWLARVVSAPFYKAVKSVDPDIAVVGFEETHQDYLREILLAEREHGRLSDIISIHEYGMPWWRPDDRFPDCLFYRLDNWFKPVIDSLGAGRPVWLSESGINAFDEPGTTTFKDLEAAIADAQKLANDAKAAGDAGLSSHHYSLMVAKQAELSSLRAPKRVEMAREYVSRFLGRAGDPSALQVERIYLHQNRSHPSIDPGCAAKDPDTYSLLFCDGTPTPSLQEMKGLLRYRRRAVGR